MGQPPPGHPRVRRCHTRAESTTSRSVPRHDCRIDPSIRTDLGDDFGLETDRIVTRRQDAEHPDGTGVTPDEDDCVNQGLGECRNPAPGRRISAHKENARIHSFPIMPVSLATHQLCDGASLVPRAKSPLRALFQARK